MNLKKTHVESGEASLTRAMSFWIGDDV